MLSKTKAKLREKLGNVRSEGTSIPTFSIESWRREKEGSEKEGVGGAGEW